MITYTEVREFLNYDSDKGLITWKKKTSTHSTQIEIGKNAGSVRKNSNQCRQIWLLGKSYKANYLAWIHYYGYPPLSLSYKNKDNQDNRIDNLVDAFNFSDFELNQDNLKSILNYDQNTGIFTRKIHFNSQARIGSIAGAKNLSGHIMIALGKKRYYAHRLAFLYMLGYIPDEVDHIDCNSSNNAWLNLRECTHSQNMCNVRKKSNNKTGFKGVCIQDDRFRVRITVNNTQIDVGNYETLEEAKLSIRQARELHHKEFTRHE